MGNTSMTCVDAEDDMEVLSDCLDERQKRLVQETLEIMRESLSELGVIVFLRFFETEPNMLRYFPKFVHINEDNQLQLSPDIQRILKIHAVAVMNAIGAAVESMEQDDIFEYVIEDLAFIHAVKNVAGRNIQKLWPSLHYGLGKVLEDSYTKEVSGAWRKVFFYLSSHMKRVMKRMSLSEHTMSTTSYSES